MLIALHALIYSDDPPATRAFLRDVLGWPFVEESDLPGWLIFKTGASELGVHPTSAPGFSSQRHHEISLVCDDIEATMADLTAKGAEFSTGVEDRGFGLTAMLKIPAADDVMVYEPKHETAYDL
jgi:predicted enzyme related to lactoylglutathione lyase